MSGGVDSSVTAHLLRRLGHDLVGVQMELWTDPMAPAMARILPSKCCHTETRARAERVAKDLKIPFLRVNYEAAFRDRIVDRYLEDHRRGRTPNPCIECNRQIKFGLLLQQAGELGCDAIATGHYARVAEEELPNGGTRKLLLEAVDHTKDQSYFLYGLSQEQLRNVLFPLGTLRKSEVFALARSFGVPLPTGYQESQDLCFFPEKTPHAFLDRYLQDAMAPGPIVYRTGKKLGEHRGLPHYTIGQRRGLRIGGLKIPLQVIAKDVTTNTLVVGTEEEATRTGLEAREVHWIAWSPAHDEDFPCEVRTCYQGMRKRATVLPMRDRLKVAFAAPQSSITPGQHVVCYRGEEVLGGGVISSVA